jgi:hypothetical protein
MENDEEFLDEEERKFLKKHWRNILPLGIVIIAGLIAGILLFLWLVADAQTTGLVPAQLGEWTVGYVITFILHVVLWELILVGSWVAVLVIVLLYRWYKELPEEEKWKRHERGRRDEGEAFGFFIGLAWLLIVWIDGRWHLAFQDWTLNDWIFSWISALLWVLLIAGIPITIFFLYWVSMEMRTKPETESE